MRLFREVLLAHSFFTNPAFAENTCDAGELKVPENAIRWNCDKEPIIEDRLSPKTKCLLQCAEGFMEIYCKSPCFFIKSGY